MTLQLYLHIYIRSTYKSYDCTLIVIFAYYPVSVADNPIKSIRFRGRVLDDDIIPTHPLTLFAYVQILWRCRIHPHPLQLVFIGCPCAGLNVDNGQRRKFLFAKHKRIRSEDVNEGDWKYKYVFNVQILTIPVVGNKTIAQSVIIQQLWSDSVRLLHIFNGTFIYEFDKKNLIIVLFACLFLASQLPWVAGFILVPVHCATLPCCFSASPSTNVRVFDSKLIWIHFSLE